MGLMVAKITVGGRVRLICGNLPHCRHFPYLVPSARRSSTPNPCQLPPYPAAPPRPASGAPPPQWSTSEGEAAAAAAAAVAAAAETMTTISPRHNPRNCSIRSRHNRRRHISRRRRSTWTRGRGSQAHCRYDAGHFVALTRALIETTIAASKALPIMSRATA
jgi:hypothetical protein